MCYKAPTAAMLAHSVSLFHTKEFRVSTHVDAVILAAGQGTRMRSSLPKVLHPLAGKPMVAHVLDTALTLPGSRAIVIVGHGAERVRAELEGRVDRFVLQAEQLGTGHALLQALPQLRDDAICLVLYGDVPLPRRDTLAELVELAKSVDIALLTVKLPDPTGYGRIIRSHDGNVAAIVEHKDATDEQRAICEVNTGILAARVSHLKRWLPALKNDNVQREYYLTDIIAMARGEGLTVSAMSPQTLYEVQGVNNRLQLAELERCHQRECAEKLMINGVTLLDPSRIDVRGTVRHGTDIVVDINVIFEGDVVIGNNVQIGANCIIRDSSIGDDVVIEPNSIIDGSIIGANATIGPFARVRPGTELKEKAKIGNFVETKKSVIGKGSKVNHLTYIGDAEIGSDANIGAGTITCNYDGVNKFKTVIGDGAFIGSNSSLVAPVTVGAMATVGAGSTITQNVPDNQLSVARGKQRNIESWKRPTKKPK
jgi:bifunctional UDP-N-acetylglucosamine pyrophosphorylase / glucosamine-1-phosphate N-acetyltransferase